MLQTSNPLNDITIITTSFYKINTFNKRKKNIKIFVRICSPQNLKRDNDIFSTYYYIIMSDLTLDGSTSFIGTEFIKLLATRSSPLATEDYVDDKVAEGGGGGASVDAYLKPKQITY